MRRDVRVPALLLAGTALLLAGCSSAGGWAEPREAPAAVGTPAAGFIPTPTPSPEATVTPVDGSWSDVHPPSGYRVVLLTAGEDAAARTLAEAVRSWARDEDVDLREVAADDDLIAGIVSAMDMNADLIVSAGNDLIDPLTTVSANHLDKQFLVVGAEVAEPTANVTAVEWSGASFRGAGLDAATPYDESTFTPERAGAAIRAGSAAVLSGMTGVVLWIG
ncbi:type 1 periplasmic-binding domain-containing protein [Microbacterium tumbae]